MWLNRALQIIIIEGNGLLSVLQFILGGLLTHDAFHQYHSQHPSPLRHLRPPWGSVDDLYYSQRGQERIPTRQSTLPDLLIPMVHHKLFQIPHLHYLLQMIF